MRKKGITELLVRSVMSLHEGAKTCDTARQVDMELSEEFDVKEGMHQGSVLSPVVVDIVTKLASEGILSETLY